MPYGRRRYSRPRGGRRPYRRAYTARRRKTYRRKAPKRRRATTRKPSYHRARRATKSRVGGMRSMFYTLQIAKPQ